MVEVSIFQVLYSTAFINLTAYKDKYKYYMDLLKSILNSEEEFNESKMYLDAQMEVFEFDAKNKIYDRKFGRLNK